MVLKESMQYVIYLRTESHWGIKSTDIVIIRQRILPKKPLTPPHVYLYDLQSIRK